MCMEQVVQLYQSHRYSCCLYLGSVFVDQFGYKPECQPKLRLMFEVSPLLPSFGFNFPRPDYYAAVLISSSVRLCVRPPVPYGLLTKGVKTNIGVNVPRGRSNCGRGQR